VAQDEKSGEQSEPSILSRGPDRPILGVLIMLALVLGWVWWSADQGSSRKLIDYSTFKQHLVAGELRDLSLAESEIRGRIVPGPWAEGEVTDAALGADAGEFSFRTVRVEDPELTDELDAAGVEYRGVAPNRSFELMLWLLPIGLLAGIWIFVLRRMAGGAGQAAVGFGKSRAKLVAETEIGVGFADVAGCDEAKVELAEVVEFLRNPDRFKQLGATIPKGVLLTGPPGTGKTLLARAVAGEADVPFYSLSGSDFVEMFVGVGAARVRDLFRESKDHAPCIVFIDELDAIGRARGVHLSNINDEREHTLNQLLVEMDGFEPNSGVIILSATNRPDVLDPALLRPGRFDRQVVLDSPDRKGRKEILEVHSRNKRLHADVVLDEIARATPGFSGADLANVMNEAALLAARHAASEISHEDIEAAVEKVIAGPERKSRRLEYSERRRVAYHEAGHALVALGSESADPVHKISIVPRGRAALGYTLQLPTGEHHLLSRADLLDRIKGLLGGRAAEQIALGDVSTGAENDLELATTIARRLVAQYGMGESVGLMHCVRGDEALVQLDLRGGLQRDCSEATASAIDEEVRGLLDAAYVEAKQLLSEERASLGRLAEGLLDRETLNREEIDRLLESG
jgi:cell division protease FtsH